MSNYVVIDTNVLVSAIHSPMGNPAKVLDMIYDDTIVVVYSDAILEEYEDVLLRPELKLNSDDVKKVLDTFKSDGLYVTPDESDISLPDEDDRCFYDAAVEADAVLVTGNLRHFPKETWIKNPADYLADMNRGDSF